MVGPATLALLLLGLADAQGHLRARTCNRFYDLQLDFENFARYDHYFQETSVLTLPPGGVYEGIEGIKEYVMLATKEGLWIEDRINPVSSISLISTNESSGECEFRLLLVNEYTIEQGWGGGTARTTLLIKLRYSPSLHKITSIALTFPEAFLWGFFHTLANTMVKGKICSILAGNCASVFASSGFTNHQECLQWLDTLPTLDIGDGAEPHSTFSRNSLGCRILHAGLAASNSKHCPHIGRFPEQDHKGRVKCQDESPVVFNEMFFDELDLENHEEFAELVDIDPKKYHYADCKLDPLIPTMLPVRRLLQVLLAGGNGMASSTCRTSKYITKAPLDHPSDEAFLWVSTLILWVTSVVTGLGIEVVVGNVLIKKMKEQEFQDYWKVAQLLFSLALAISLLSHSVFGLPFLVFGLWKFGCPETTTYLRHATQKASQWERSTAAINCAGTLMHHFIASWFVCCLVTGAEHVNRDVLALTLPLVVQHWFVLLKYVHYGVYVGTILLVEAVWQWECLYHAIDMDHEVNLRATIVIMLTAHWLYILGFVVEKRFFIPTRKSMPEERSTAPTIDRNTTAAVMIAAGHGSEAATTETTA